MLQSERIRKWAKIIIVLSVVTTIVIMYFNDLSFVIIWDVTFIILLFESILFLISFGIAKLIEKLSGQKPTQKTTGKIGKRKQPNVNTMNNMHSQEVQINRQEPNKCSKCGNVIEDETIFCDKCGSRVR